MKTKEQIIKAYKKKHQDIIHPNQLTISELQMLDFCIEYFTQQPESGKTPTDKALTEYINKKYKEYIINGDDVNAYFKNCLIDELKAMRDNEIPITDERKMAKL